MAWIILRDVPKHRAQLDATVYAVGGGFRGFANVVPGYHCVRVLPEGGAAIEAELAIARERDVVVFRPGGGSLIREDDRDAEALARSSAMDRALVDVLAVNRPTTLAWPRATSLLEPPLAASPADGFEALQADFARAVIYDDRAAADRMIAAIRSGCRAGERAIAAGKEEHERFAGMLSAMIVVAPLLVHPKGTLREPVEAFIEDLRDAGATDAGAELATAVAATD